MCLACAVMCVSQPAAARWEKWPACYLCISSASSSADFSSVKPPMGSLGWLRAQRPQGTGSGMRGMFLLVKSHQGPAPEKCHHLPVVPHIFGLSNSCLHHHAVLLVRHITPWQVFHGMTYNTMHFFPTRSFVFCLLLCTHCLAKELSLDRYSK